MATHELGVRIRMRATARYCLLVALGSGGEVQSLLTFGAFRHGRGFVLV